jgi:hypothetical protein
MSGVLFLWWSGGGVGFRGDIAKMMCSVPPRYKNGGEGAKIKMYRDGKLKRNRWWMWWVLKRTKGWIERKCSVAPRYKAENGKDLMEMKTKIGVLDGTENGSKESDR